MPMMDWDSFQEAHYRPHLIVANVDDANGPRQCEANVSVLGCLAEALDILGNYALKRDGTTIRAVFEKDIDAERFAATVLAQTTARSSEWASQAAFSMDRIARRKVTEALKRLRSKNAKERSRTSPEISTVSTR